MNYKPLGKSGIKVSELCLGTMTFGRETDENTAAYMLDHFLNAGGNFIDTADIYGQAYGTSEGIIGRLLKGRRNNLILATKVGFGSGPNSEGLSRRHLIEALETSLQRLKTDWIDVYYLHAYDAVTPFEETLRTMDALITAGKVRYFGISNFAAWHIMKILGIIELHSFSRCTVYQPQYNLLEREIEREFVPICQTEGLGMVCWAPLAGGLLSGKYNSSEKVDGRLNRMSSPNTDSWENRVNDFTLLIVKAVEAIANRKGVCCAQVALNWLRSKAWVTCPIIGARTFEQYRENMACLDWNLDAADGQALDRVSVRPAPYPYKFISRLQRG